ncbi:MAG: RnfABCDGE type electron transport complex subunit B [Gammaproteobacteria bacterium]|nr:RnfABCDGE type electron transport complex subunit B [Gammaproteobacteria bacterium]
MLVAVITLGGLTFLIASALVIAQSRLRVDEDPRIEPVYDLLPHTDCGACGYPGCRAFAEALAAAETNPARCTVSGDEEKQAIAEILSVEVSDVEKVVARLACAGGANVARMHADYDGLDSCRGAALVAGGGKGCFWGCLGIGDCAAVCDFEAIDMSSDKLPVVNEALCTACGDCVDACPKDLFSLQPVSHRLWVACKNLEFGDEVLDECKVACTACGKCAKDATGGLIAMQDNLPVIDYTRPHNQRQAIDRCPTGAIVWFEPGKTPQKGPAARKIVRRGARHVAPT